MTFPPVFVVITLRGGVAEGFGGRRWSWLLRAGWHAANIIFRLTWLVVDFILVY